MRKKGINSALFKNEYNCYFPNGFFFSLLTHMVSFFIDNLAFLLNDLWTEWVYFVKAVHDYIDSLTEGVYWAFHCYL